MKIFEEARAEIALNEISRQLTRIGDILEAMLPKAPDTEVSIDYIDEVDERTEDEIRQAEIDEATAPSEGDFERDAGEAGSDARRISELVARVLGREP